MSDQEDNSGSPVVKEEMGSINGNVDENGSADENRRSRSRSASHESKRSKSRDHTGKHSRRRHRSHSHSRSRSHHRSSRRRKSRSRSRSYERRSRSRSPMSSRRRHVAPREDPPPTRCIGVFGLSLYSDEKTLDNYFSQFGKIDQIQLVYDKKTGRSRGFGFIYFDNVEDAINAKERAAGVEIDGHRIRVDFSITKRPHTPTPGIYMGKPTRRHDNYYGGNRNRSPSPYYGSRRGRSRSYSPYRNRRSRSYSYSPRRD